MGKRKVFNRSDLSVPQVEQGLDEQGRVVVLPEAIPPVKTVIAFGRNATSARNFDFAPWYGVGIDPITYACQRQIERFLGGQDSDVEISTVVAYCRSGLRYFFDYLVLRATALGCALALANVDRSLVDGYLSHIAGSYFSTGSQKNMYSFT